MFSVMNDIRYVIFTRGLLHHQWAMSDYRVIIFFHLSPILITSVALAKVTCRFSDGAKTKLSFDLLSNAFEESCKPGAWIRTVVSGYPILTSGCLISS